MAEHSESSSAQFVLLYAKPADEAKGFLHRRGGRPYIRVEYSSWKGLNMSSFDDRKRGEEAKFALDAATEFKVMARRNKLLGIWAAELLGLEGPAVEEYAKSVVISDLEEAGDDDVFRKVRSDFDAQSVDRSDQRIREHMAELLPIAREQILNEAT